MVPSEGIHPPSAQSRSASGDLEGEAARLRHEVRELRVVLTGQETEMASLMRDRGPARGGGGRRPVFARE